MGKKSKQKRQLKRARDASAAPASTSVSSGAAAPPDSSKKQKKMQQSGDETAVEIEALGFEDAFSAGLAFEQLASYEGALTAFQAAVKRRPTHLGALTHLADVHSAAGQPDEALRCYEQASALADGAKDASVWFRLGLARAALEKHTEATKAYNKALEISAEALEAAGEDAEDDEDAEELRKAYGVTLAALAEAFGELGDLNAAVKVFEQATKRFPSNGNLYYNLAAMRMARNGSKGNNDFDCEVQRCLERAIACSPDTRAFLEELAEYLTQHEQQPDRVRELKAQADALPAEASSEQTEQAGDVESESESNSEEEEEEEEEEGEGE